MKKSLCILTAAALLVGAAACSASKQTKSKTEAEAIPAEQIVKLPENIIGGNASMAMPKAVIYRTSGNYADYVPVTTNAEATALVTYPDPTDITQQSKPIKLADGYLLDRRGVGPNTFFTRYTYAQYAKLKQVPTQQQLMDSIMPGAYVTEIVQLPMTANAAASDTTLVNRLIRSGLPNCKVVWTIPTLEL